MSINLIATTTFGLEAVVKRECQALAAVRRTCLGENGHLYRRYLYRAIRPDEGTAVGRLDSGGREIHRCREVRKIHPVQRFGLSGNRQEGCCRKAEGKI